MTDLPETITTTPIAPVRIERTIAHVNRGEQGSGFEEIDSPRYAQIPESALVREARVAAGLTLGEAARRLGIRVSEMSGLERSSHYPSCGWERLLELLRGARKDGRDG